MKKEDISKVMAHLGSLRHIKSPISLEKRREMQRLSTEAKKRKKILDNFPRYIYPYLTLTYPYLT